MRSKTVRRRVLLNRWKRSDIAWVREREKLLRTYATTVKNSFLPVEYRYSSAWDRAKAVEAMSREECKVWMCAERKAIFESLKIPDTSSPMGWEPSRAAINTWMAGETPVDFAQPYQPADAD